MRELNWPRDAVRFGGLQLGPVFLFEGDILAQEYLAGAELMGRRNWEGKVAASLAKLAKVSMAGAR